MDLKDKVTVWAGLLTLAALQVQDRVDTELNLYGSDWVGAVVTVVYSAIGLGDSVWSPQMDSGTIFQRKNSATAHATTTIRTAPKVAGIGFALHSYSLRACANQFAIRMPLVEKVRTFVRFLKTGDKEYGESILQMLEQSSIRESNEYG